MRASPFVVLLALMLTTFGGVAEAQRAVAAGRIAAGTLSFDGRSTVGDFTGTTAEVMGEMSGGADVTEVRGWVEAPVRSLVTGNRKRDKDLNKSLESEKYPTIRFDLTGVRPGEVRGDTARVTLLGRFRIHGVEHADSMPATVVLAPDGARVRARTTLNLKDYAIGGLSKGLGMLKVQEVIVVRLDLSFTAAPVLGAVEDR